ncbi:MAG: [protein-PII] uridylyltransferase, partial [Actinomycetota bacterium]|nr:[protein-PII] uridylyltransferase [Actinomycetota bacterium]
GIDRALSALAKDVFANISGVALVAVGGYGRGELSPHSDIDLLFAVSPRVDVTPATLRGLLYPLWDAGFQVGHAVRTPKIAVERAAHDLDAATSLLTMRLIEGDAEIFDELRDRRGRWLNKHGSGLLRRILEARAEHHRSTDRAGWALAPDLKDGVGGLRDVHRVLWLQQIAGPAQRTPELLGPAGVLIAVREALHAELKRKSDRVRIDLQPNLAERLGYDGEFGVEELMSEVHGAARAIEHSSALAIEDLTEHAERGPRRSGNVEELAEGVRLEDGRLIAARASGKGGLERAMWLLAAKAATGRPVDRASVEWMEEIFHQSIEKWTRRLTDAFLALLAGAHATSALEMMDHIGAWRCLLPEWATVTKLAQHDPYHRYTVDGHSFMAVGELNNAIETDAFGRAAAAEAGELEALRVATLFHDIGKGSGEDHSVMGELLARSACMRMGLSTEATDDVAALVRWHLLLPDTATRRDLDDGSVIAQVADTIANPRRLRLLYLLAVADGRATGPEAWNEWKAILVRELYLKVLNAIETGELPARSDVAARAKEVETYEPTLTGRAEDVLATLPPSYLDATLIEDMVDDVRMLLTGMRPGEIRHRIDPAAETGQFVITVCVKDRPGTLARTAGVLSLHRISVLRAQAYSTTGGLALERFVVLPPAESWVESFSEDLKAAYSGRLAVEARLEKKTSDYRPSGQIVADVSVLNDASPHSTVVEVRAPDALGLLYAITAALGDLDLDIHVAKIDTLGARVVDVFYVRSSWGGKLDDAQTDEVKRSIAHRVARLLGA